MNGCTYYERVGYSSIADCMRDQKLLTELTQEEYEHYQCSQGVVPYTTMIVIGFIVLISAIIISNKIFFILEPVKQWASSKDNAFIMLSKDFLVPISVFIIVWASLFFISNKLVTKILC